MNLKEIQFYIDECEDKNSADWGYEEGVLMSANDAQKLLDAITALKEIAKAEGAYSKSPLLHAESTIANMQKIATDYLSSISTNA